MLRFENISYRLGSRLLLENGSANIPQNAHCGLIGRNGCGKSTLFRLILGEISLEAGRITIPSFYKVGHVAQEAPGGAISLLEYVLAADEERASLLKEAETATSPERISEIQIRLIDIDAHSAPSRAASILSGLGFDEEAQARSCSEFSGGWRMRVALAGMLFLEPDLLLLDEPTNYLDIEGTIWLKSHLQNYPHTLLLISHDRDFLDNVVDNILHLEQGKLNFYRGNYTSFARVRAEKTNLLEKSSVKIAAKRAHLQKFIDRFKAKASKAKQAQSRVKQLEKLGDVVPIIIEEDARIFMPDPAQILAPPLLVLEKISVGYDDRVVLKDLDLSISPDDRIGLLGQNGNGKSTFVKLIAEKIKPFSGNITRSSKMKIAYFAQHQLDELSLEETPLSLVRKKMPQAKEAEVRSKAAQLGFKVEKAQTKIENLSGGEKARLLLGLAAFEGPHLLILDEPTNHLDIPMREALTEALAEYKGAAIIVSHDRNILDACCDKLWLVADGGIKTFDGDLTDYENLILSSRTKTKVKINIEQEEEVCKSSDNSKDTFLNNMDTALEKKNKIKILKERSIFIEKQSEKLRTLLIKVDETLAKPGIFAEYPKRAAQISRDRATLAEQIAKMEDEWLILLDELEKTQSN